MRRLALVFALSLLGVGAAPVTAGLAWARPDAAAPAAAVVRADFDNDGFADLAIGVPGEDVGSVADAGAVDVLYGAATGLAGTGSQQLTQVGSAPEAGDWFGGALAAGDFNNDGFADLAVAAPFEASFSVARAGAVTVFSGSANGLTTAGGQTFTQPGSAAEVNDTFGMALAAGDFNNDGFVDLAGGAPGEAAFSVPGAGAVSVLRGSATGLTTTGGQIFTQSGDPAEAGDRYGGALAAGDVNLDGFADLAAGSDGEDVNSATDTGMISVLRGSATGLTATGGQLVTQQGSVSENGDQFGAAVAFGDFNGDGFADLAAGAPFEDYLDVLDAGAVSVLPGSASGLVDPSGLIFTQVGSAPEPNDLFGSALATGDFNKDGRADLAVGAPAEDSFASVLDAGAVSVLPGSATGLTTTGGQIFTQIGSAPETGDRFGNALVAADFNGGGFADLAAGAVNEDAFSLPDAGAVSAAYGSTAGLTTAGSQIFTQGTAGVPDSAEVSDHLGWHVA